MLQMEINKDRVICKKNNNNNILDSVYIDVSVYPVCSHLVCVARRMQECVCACE